MRTLEIRFQEHARPSNLDKDPNSQFYKDIATYGIENFQIEQLDTCFERHRYIIEEYWWHKLFDEHYLMYEIKMGTSHSLNTKQRIAVLRNQDAWAEKLKTEEFKQRTSEKTSGELNGMWGKKDEAALNGRIVVAFYDPECTQVFKEFNSVKTALQFLGISGHLGLNQACRPHTLYKGYYWSKEWINR